jgi:hypothetical protein
MSLEPPLIDEPAGEPIEPPVAVPELPDVVPVELPLVASVELPLPLFPKRFSSMFFSPL